MNSIPSFLFLKVCVMEQFKDCASPDNYRVFEETSMPTTGLELATRAAILNTRKTMKAPLRSAS
jgi:hypothetical protein